MNVHVKDAPDYVTGDPEDFMTNELVLVELKERGWFQEPGAYAVVDGQFGSTGKGLLCGLMGEAAALIGRLDVATCNAGPNSGHTAYCPVTGQKIVTQQLPISAITYNRVRRNGPDASGYDAMTYLNGGAIVDLDITMAEVEKFHPGQPHMVEINPQAAVIEQIDRDGEGKGSAASKIAGTAKGVGHALARKANRCGNVYREFHNKHNVGNVLASTAWNWDHERVMVELSQGFSLGVHSDFYPHTTSRECTVMQGLADARIPAKRLRKVAACFRTFPIRVGNTSDGQSGSCYPDQHEISWEAINQEPEMTTVTKRVRRLFTWSRLQFVECIAANEPDLVFLNFTQYLDSKRLAVLCSQIRTDYCNTLGRPLETLLLGFGAYNGDVVLAS